MWQAMDYFDSHDLASFAQQYVDRVTSVFIGLNDSPNQIGLGSESIDRDHSVITNLFDRPNFIVFI
jgi:hypothetical protein